MDPLSIIAGVTALLTASVKVGLALKDFYDGTSLVDVKVKGVLTEVDGFSQVLKLVKSSLEEKEIQSSLHSTGHIGEHWDSLSMSIRDGLETVKHLQVTVEKANKSVRLLDAPRRHLRMRGAADEIAVYQQQIRSYKDAMQLSLQVMVLSNTISLRESTHTIVPNLEEIQRFIQQVAVDLNSQISGLEDTVQSNSRDHDRRLGALINLRSYARSAATVVSSASTTLGADLSDRLSDFGDCFPPEQGEAMHRWISSHTVYEFAEEEPVGFHSPHTKSLSINTLQGDKESDKLSHSDSDDDLEAEIFQSLLRRGRKALDSDDFEAAERHLRNCLARVSANNLSIPSQNNIDNKLEVMKLLISAYRHQEKWDEARSLLTEKIALGSRGFPEANKDVLPDTLILVEILLRKAEHAEALLYGRRALKGYKKLGPTGISGVDQSLVLLCQICKAAGSHDDEEAYASILLDVRQRQQAMSDPFADEGSVVVEQKSGRLSHGQRVAENEAVVGSNTRRPNPRLPEKNARRVQVEKKPQPSFLPAQDPLPQGTGPDVTLLRAHDDRTPNSESARAVDQYDWDAIFADLPTASSNPFKDGNSSSQSQRQAEPTDWDEIFASIDSPGPNPNANGHNAPSSNIHNHDDPILRKLLKMGFSRSDSVNALEKHDYHLEQAIAYLNQSTSKSTEKQAMPDWDAIFAGLDTPSPNAKPPRSDIHIHDDPILKRLVDMGYGRNHALAALEKYDYDIERAAEYLRSRG